ncbi:MAG: cadherin-like beta sandwich domain-containing protein, partial [Gammaproteobacteria bacterium]|nr:cadherin-like beta sandwich domain-containing protein [Gammaproteobacteria bacterium]
MSLMNKILVLVVPIFLVACGPGAGSNNSGNVDANTYLSDVLISEDITLDPPFNRYVTNYTGEVTGDATSFSMTAIADALNSQVTINGEMVNPGSPSQDIQLAVGSNIIEMVVSAPDGSSEHTYVFIVNRNAATNANLANLVLSSGELNKTFSPFITDYLSIVPYDIESTTLDLTAQNTGAVVTVNGEIMVPGQPSQDVPLSVGSNTIRIIVTAEDGQTRTAYNAVIIRNMADGSTPPSVSTMNLSELNLLNANIDQTFN